MSPHRVGGPAPRRQPGRIRLRRREPTRPGSSTPPRRRPAGPAKAALTKLLPPWPRSAATATGWPRPDWRAASRQFSFAISRLGHIVKTLSVTREPSRLWRSAPTATRLAPVPKTRPHAFGTWPTARPLRQVRRSHADGNRGGLRLAGGQAVSGSADNSLKLWNMADGAEVKNFAGHTGAIVAVAMTSNNARVVSASADQTVRTWNPADGRKRVPYRRCRVTRRSHWRATTAASPWLTDNSVKLFQIGRRRGRGHSDGSRRAGANRWHSAPTTFARLGRRRANGPSSGTSPARL